MSGPVLILDLSGLGPAPVKRQRLPVRRVILAVIRAFSVYSTVNKFKLAVYKMQLVIVRNFAGFSLQKFFGYKQRLNIFILPFVAVVIIIMFRAEL